MTEYVKNALAFLFLSQILTEKKTTTKGSQQFLLIEQQVHDTYNRSFLLMKRQISLCNIFGTLGSLYICFVYTQKLYGCAQGTSLCNLRSLKLR